MEQNKVVVQRQWPHFVREIWQARNRIYAFARKTPLVHSVPLSRDLGTSMYLKLDYLQEIGAFKIRGAANKILSLSETQRAKGITTFSTGNHGLAVSYVAAKLGLRAVVCVSHEVPQMKVHAIEQMGGEVKRVGSSQDEAAEYSYKLVQDEGMTVIKPFDDETIIAGQGTLGLELWEECPDLDTVLVPLSGGGLMAGVAMAVKSVDPSVRIIGVSMESGAAMYESLKAGKPVDVDEAETLADSLRGGIGLDNKFTFPIVRELADEIVLVSEEDIKAGLRYLYQEHRMLVEGAAATPVAAAMTQLREKLGRHNICLLTGNNVDPSILEEVLRS
ncbi:hydroxyectoine utilization dehydratase EutB [Alicyclobacillus sp. SO9]|uniref:hydroxyectoine utilization dehydratase EutB n=1 Tax=Alicyclobacillus sp. SO9 TaxID=2665646 RepID=UPI0018E6F778|nr:hydroxyectoine utilization dehydratase EutB [Alicyclobacillus sp. SO9]QQE79036.1 hydroxyectoine utilization dehydratase EutB [Alicyclobacillus sp. SO9]